jgi:hypothetical protein
MVSILSTFNVGKAKGPDGVEIEIDPDALTGGVIRQAQDRLHRVFSLTYILIVHRNRLFARLFLDLPELKASFTMPSMVYIQMRDFGCSRQSRTIHYIFRYLFISGLYHNGD